MALVLTEIVLKGTLLLNKHLITVANQKNVFQINKHNSWTHVQILELILTVVASVWSALSLVVECLQPCSVAKNVGFEVHETRGCKNKVWRSRLSKSKAGETSNGAFLKGVFSPTVCYHIFIDSFLIFDFHIFCDFMDFDPCLVLYFSEMDLSCLFLRGSVLTPACPDDRVFYSSY